MKPVLRALYQWFKQFVVQSGFRDGKAGWEVARWSALAAFWKWRLVTLKTSEGRCVLSALSEPMRWETPC